MALSLISTTIGGTPTLVLDTTSQTLIPPTTPVSQIPAPSGSGGAGTGPGGANGGDNPPPPPTSTASTLYLYTFLATLVVLLGVSGSVLIRSVVLRVRARRAIEEAIRNGTYVSPEELEKRKKKKYTKPDFFDAYASFEKHGSWENVQPVSATFVPSPLLSSTDSSAPTHNTPRSTARFYSLLDLFSRSRASRVSPALPVTVNDVSTTATAPDSPSPNSIANEDTLDSQTIQPSSVRVTFLIAMPHASQPTPNAVAESDPELPVLEFGVTEVPILPSGRGFEDDTRDAPMS